MQNETPIIQKTYDFYRELYLVVEKMPKKDKYSLGERLQKTTLDLLELVITASCLERVSKFTYLEKSSIKLDLIKILVRLTYEIKAIDNKKYLLLQGKLQEIGKMLGGWLRSIKAPGQGAFI